MIVAEPDPDRRTIWDDVFSDIADVQIVAVDAMSLHSLAELDAELMPGVLVHERYGGIEQRWDSLVLSTKNDENMPEFVVTTPTLPAHFEHEEHCDGTPHRVLVPDVQYAPAQETSAGFRSMLRAVKRFNKSHAAPQIRVIGFSTDLMNLRGPDLRGHAEAVRDAYLSELGAAAPRPGSRD
jgi:hypothetical protein